MDHCSSSERKKAKQGITDTRSTSVVAKLLVIHLGMDDSQSSNSWEQSTFIYSKAFTDTLETHKV